MNKIPIIKKGYVGGMDFQNSYSGYSFILLMLFFIVIGAFFLTLFLRLFQLTVVKGDYYRRLSENNRIREVVIEPQRGSILDRKGGVLAQSIEADLQQEGTRLLSKRTYMDPEVFAHLVGYRQQADEKDIKNDSCWIKIKSNDKFVDKVGKKGVEKLFDCELRGKYGKKLIEVDARGTVVRPLHVVPPENGKTVQLSVDGELQKIAYNRIKDVRAAVVGLRPSTGEVLVLASSPSFNPQVFEDSDNKAITSYLKNDVHPMFNRATEGTYPSGSTFKLVVASAALEEKKITRDTVIEDTGYIQAGTLKFGNWAYIKSGKKDGLVNVVTALKRSNDIYFYKIGERLGAENIKKWAERFGFNHKTGIGIEENAGTVPSPFWKEDTLNEKWYLGDTYNFSIGQGYFLATPLQVAKSTQIIANQGTACQPTLLKVDSETNKPLFATYPKENCEKLPISQNTIDTVIEGMVAACTTGGTAWPLFNFTVDDPTSPDSGAARQNNEEASSSAKLPQKKINLACKTGTAETHLASKIPYAWFTIYAPVENPEIVLTILIEEGGEGSDVAAPIAKDILKAYFERVE